MAAAVFRLCDVTLDRSFGGRDARFEREQARCNDLLENNVFTPVGYERRPFGNSL
ncbi:hypothetical protein [Mesorhizobium sp. M0895]|uniref:hypothetical protein n=1 Tax=Mesorhizobium sp. M0895 TaxID=2957019 RepID=UPI003339EAD6